jgi:arabinogalactan oligomer/maltooligosaccharide transport system permease protein
MDNVLNDGRAEMKAEGDGDMANKDTLSKETLNNVVSNMDTANIDMPDKNVSDGDTANRDMADKAVVNKEVAAVRVTDSKKHGSLHKRAVNILVHVFLGVLAAVWLLPILWIVLTSFRAEPGAYTGTFLPQGYTLNNYIKLFTDRNVINFPKMFMNTLIIAVFCCIISTFFVLSVSYSLSRLRFKLRKPYMNLAMVLGLFPGFMTMVAQYFILKSMGLSEGSAVRIGLIVVYTACTGLGFQIAKGYLDTIPRSIDEAAMIDGATQWQIFTKITIPLSKPIIIYTVMTSFIAPWIDFIFAKVLCRANSDQWTVAIGLWNMLQKEYIYRWYTCFAAGAVVISIPIAVLFLFMQKFYVEGVNGAVKG